MREERYWPDKHVRGNVGCDVVAVGAAWIETYGGLQGMHMHKKTDFGVGGWRALL